MFGHQVSCPFNIMVEISLRKARKILSIPLYWLESAMNNAFNFSHQNLRIAARRQ